MTVISLSITESAEEVVSGIPRFVSVSANITSVIFYTLDGTAPTTNSFIYVEKIQLPTDELKITLSFFATNGTDSSPVITNVYQTIQLGKNARTSHSGTDAQPNSTQGLNDPYPFGTNPIMPGQIFLGAGEAGLNVDNPLLPETPSGFNADGYDTGFTNEPLIGIPTKTQALVYSTTDSEGQMGPGIGTFPPFTVQKPVPPPQQSDSADKLFDPRALVIFQDFTKANDPNLPVEINRQFYSQSDLSTDRDGAAYFNSYDVPAPTGTFLRQHYNPTDQTLTYYYFNSRDNRWIISKTAFTPAPKAGTYFNLVFGKDKGAGFVFKWVAFKANYLF